MQSLNSFDSIGISSFGRNYLNSPKLVVIDGYTNKVVPEVDLDYELGDTHVTILNNSTGMYEIKPTIIPTQNTNGVGISSLTYNNATKIARLYLNQTFSTSREFPFIVGEKILIENVNIGTGSSGVGYNSVDHDYTLFPVTAVKATTWWYWKHILNIVCLMYLKVLKFQEHLLETLVGNS